jgi:hypothetical protein
MPMSSDTAGLSPRDLAARRDAAVAAYHAAAAIMNAEVAVLDVRTADASALKDEAVRQLAVAQYRQAQAQAQAQTSGDQAAIDAAALAVFDAALHLIQVTGTNIVELAGMLPVTAANIRAVEQTDRAAVEANAALTGPVVQG